MIPVHQNPDLELDLSNMDISDLSPLTVCKGLKKLDITGNHVSDLTPLMDLLSKRETWPEAEVVRLGRDIAAALCAALTASL